METITCTKLMCVSLLFHAYYEHGSLPPGEEQARRAQNTSTPLPASLPTPGGRQDKPAQGSKLRGPTGLCMAPRQPKSANLRYARCGGLVGCVRAGEPDRSLEGGWVPLSVQAPAAHTHSHTHTLRMDFPVLCALLPRFSDHPPPSCPAAQQHPTPTTTHTPNSSPLRLSLPLTHPPVALTCNYRPSKAHRCKKGQPALSPSPPPRMMRFAGKAYLSRHTSRNDLCVGVCVIQGAPDRSIAKRDWGWQAHEMFLVFLSIDFPI